MRSIRSHKRSRYLRTESERRPRSSSRNRLDHWPRSSKVSPHGRGTRSLPDALPRSQLNPPCDPVSVRGRLTGCGNQRHNSTPASCFQCEPCRTVVMVSNAHFDGATSLFDLSDYLFDTLNFTSDLSPCATDRMVSWLHGFMAYWLPG